ncbi:rRNA maturation RNase YbeY [Acetobacterium woodii]|uniref:Endoribonuclease YbeY n=1 Tax=Acetobacterium woodii (strain ATCC 29683 / DSM 1030 / JCM 2381 / KCTC 1655 / WB1) TaxID=931626 RepID=H6LJE2_ACEWD|nr:rRNA maturation RNase YbeY [Acetobacterium woodii]AFA48705.1 putative metalloprotease [Acetobacterium woodii DSM 1030]
MLIVAYDNRSDIEIEDTALEEIEDAMMRTLLHQEVEIECEISFSFVSPDEIKELNAEYRKKDTVTDVLSFPMHEDFCKNKKAIICDNPYLPLLLGDIVICTRQAEIQAKEYGNTFTRELSYLSVHSVLHLLGYDHMEEADKLLMRSIEKEIMNDD